MIPPQQIRGFLAQQKQHSRNAKYYAEFEDLHDRKLWHQLTKKIEAFIEEGVYGEDELIQLHAQFIVDFEERIDKIALVTFLKAAAKQMKDLNAAIHFLKEYVVKLKGNTEAIVVCDMEAASYYLRKGDIEMCKKCIEECEKLLEELPGVEPGVHSSFYKVCAEYEKIKGNFVEYHKNALLYLACVPLSSISDHEKYERANDLVVASLLGNTIYHFGELVAHDILKSLIGTPNEWLSKLLHAFNSGNISEFESLVPKIQTHVLLGQEPYFTFLKEKISLMCLLEIMFSRTADDRNVPFHVIAERAKISKNTTDQVERLVMKAMSLKLIKGVIDEVDESVKITWVQPRVLDLNQVSEIRTSLLKWSQKVKDTSDKMLLTTPELFPDRKSVV